MLSTAASSGDEEELRHRIRQLLVMRPLPGWTSKDYFEAAREARRRQSAVWETFGIEYPMFNDAVRAIEPSFELTIEDERIARTLDLFYGSTHLIVRNLLRWERCPKTQPTLNPYEPWLWICEHGGRFQIEHQEFVDVFDDQGRHLGSAVAPSMSAATRLARARAAAAEADARITDRRCDACGQPRPTYRRTCKYCGRA